MLNPKQGKTVLLIKPDGVKRGLIGEAIARVEKRGLKIVALEMFKATKGQIDKHYPNSKEWITRVGKKTLGNYKNYGIDPVKEIGTDDPYKIGKKVRSWLIDYLTSGPMVKMVIEGVHAVEMVRKIAGSTAPADAALGTIRGDFSVDDASAANRDKRAIFNIVHASETQKEAEHELYFWFAAEDIFEYEREDAETF